MLFLDDQIFAKVGFKPSLEFHVFTSVLIPCGLLVDVAQVRLPVHSRSLKLSIINVVLLLLFRLLMVSILSFGRRFGELLDLWLLLLLRLQLGDLLLQ